MIRVLVSGRLYGSPVHRTGSGGKPFVTAKLRVDIGEEASAWASVIAFGAESERLGGLKDGDAVLVAGRATLQAFTGKSGTVGASLSIVADDVAAARSRPKAVRTGGSASPTRRPEDDFGDMDELAGQA
jgi:single-stranded DNA-binding protein